MHPRDQGTCLTSIWKLLLIPALVSPNFTIGHMICLHSLSFRVMESKGYFMVFDIAELKDFHALFC